MNVITSPIARFAPLVLGVCLVSSCFRVGPPPGDGENPPVVDGPGATPPLDPAQLNGEYPLAKPTGTPNQVASPYEPFNVIDVTGFQSGQLARDPSNRKIFRVP